MPIKTNDVTKCLRFFINCSFAFTADNDGYVTNTRDDDYITIKDGDIDKKLILYQESINDNNALILNPFAEGLGDNASSNWFYRMNRLSVITKIISIMNYVITKAVDENKKNKNTKTEEKEKLPLELIDTISVIINDVDETTIKEFAQITEEPTAFINLVYVPRQMRSNLRCALFEDDDWKIKYPKIRKKTWSALENLFKKILHIESGDDLCRNVD